MKGSIYIDNKKRAFLPKIYGHILDILVEPQGLILLYNFRFQILCLLAAKRKIRNLSTCTHTTIY